MKQDSFVNKVIKAGGVPIHLVRCKDAEGRDCFFFILCSLQKAKALSEAFKHGSVDLTDYGEIVVSGFGREPTAEAKRLLKEKYNFDAEGM